MLELVNRERAKAVVQPLAFDRDLNEAAGRHSQWMINTDTFSHVGAGRSQPHDRMVAAGYTFTGAWASGENAIPSRAPGPAARTSPWSAHAPHPDMQTKCGFSTIT